MADTIPDLWADDIRVDVLSPLAILKVQQSLLSKRTQGLLEAKISTVNTESTIEHYFDLTAPAIQNYQERVLVATHSSDRVYPVRVKAECFKDHEKYKYKDYEYTTDDPRVRQAYTESEFIKYVRAVFQSSEVVSTIHSLIAQSNEALAAPPPTDAAG